MKLSVQPFDLNHTLHELAHFLPAQAPLKDFIHHNTLHAFQDKHFHEALSSAARMFGYKTYLSLSEYRKLFAANRINDDTLTRVITERFGEQQLPHWKTCVVEKKFNTNTVPYVGQLRSVWDKVYDVDLEVVIQPELFRVAASYLDQGISIWNFPVTNTSFLESLREIEKSAMTGFFKTPRAKKLLCAGCSIPQLLQIIVGDEALFRDYLFDQQLSHQGWSGLVATIEAHPHTLVDERKITLHDFIVFELLLEIDALDHKFGEIWSPLCHKVSNYIPLAARTDEPRELDIVYSLWQEAYEWSYYDEVLSLLKPGATKSLQRDANFQAVFCIDDRECSLRRHLERIEPECETFGAPGFFGVEFYFQPEHGKSYSRLCPAPVRPRHLVKEINTSIRQDKEIHLSRQSHSLLWGFFISQTVGFWSVLRLFLNIFRPSMSAGAATSFRQMDKHSLLTIEHTETAKDENGLQVGFTIEEMATRVEKQLRSIGLVKDFAPLVYMVGHGSSSNNNPHYAAYDCGACSGRPGSVNARVFSYMANHPKVRTLLAKNGLVIPESTRFIGALHDTTRDDMVFFDEHLVPKALQEFHRLAHRSFNTALDFNARERSRRLASIPKHLKPRKIHRKIRTRSVSIFEPRPELNHATNALCIVGRRSVSKPLFLDRRAFLNSYNYELDPQGLLLKDVMRPLGPVCGGINLEYYFSRVDNHKLGAGTKLPHNVVGLFGVANGVDGDLRPGLPGQMTEVHEPVRLLMVVEHFPEVVLSVVNAEEAIGEWYTKEWIHLVVLHPETGQLFRFRNNAMQAYTPQYTGQALPVSLDRLVHKDDNIRVHLIK